MDFLSKTNIQFMKYRKSVVWLSILLLVVALAELFVLPKMNIGVNTGINFGIDFAGGTQLTVRLREEADIDQLRRALESAGLRSPAIQRYGAEEDQEILIKTPVAVGSEEGTSKAVIEALVAELNRDEAHKLDLNQRGKDALSTAFMEVDPDAQVATEDRGKGYYDQVAEAVVNERNTHRIFTSWDQVEKAEGLSASAFTSLKDMGTLGAFTVMQNDNVGPQIGSELRSKGLLAVLLSFIGMLMYIWFRFELRFGIGALVAVVHDFLITLGLYAIFNFEFNLPTIAAFLTLVGYSVNDTVVIFDRVRENRRRHRRKGLEEVIDLSINQTLSRTVLTSGTTLMVVTCLFLLGGASLQGFAFVLLVGVFVGTYSSVFVASPFTLLWEEYFGADSADKKAKGGKKAKATA